ncbi:hypothetical protein [Nesterenkonia sp. NBAIMH1]|uniref:hypothetical protein n=1 Tax=Nesterenkonia sp. NBAIMH1 TaxID=2600320 RepID=UPI001FEFF601|nr:hypothetical protein [Nesterenkonia sp. NBAIMH1]
MTSALLVAFLIGALIDGTDAEWLMPYVDPAVLALVALVLLPVPFSTLRRAVAEISLVTPPELKVQAEEAAGAVAAAHGFLDHRVYAAQQGRARTIDVIYYVPAEKGLRPLEEWDSIRDETRAQLDGEDPHSWITISFTTKAPPPQPRS